MTKELIAEFEGHQIRVVNTWFSGAKLYIDGECRDTDTHFLILSAKTALLSARIDGRDGKQHIVEVHAVAWWTVKLRISVDGRQIGGERI